MARILLVEDNALNCDMLSRRLQRSGYNIEVAMDGVQGLALANTITHDLILLDLSLPKLDGFEVLRRLRENLQTREIPVMALTAHAMATDRERVMAAGFDEYETKPIEFPHLLEKIDALLSRRKSS